MTMRQLWDMSDGAWKHTARISAVIATSNSASKAFSEADFPLDNRHKGPKLLTLQQRCDRWGVKMKAKDGV